MPSFPAQTFDSFSDPYTRPADESSLDEIRSHIRSLEQQHKQNGISLTGRIIHVCHYLPIVATYKSGNNGLPSPPATPTARAVEFVPHESSESPISLISTNATPSDNCDAIPRFSPTVWKLAPRFGYAATISGIRSLSMTHEQVIVGWTGDIECAGPTDKVPARDISMEDRIAFEEVLKSYTPKESDPDDDKRTTYVPVWLDDKVAHGHYDGYCKQSEHSHHSCCNLELMHLLNSISYSALAAVPLFALARCRYGICFSRSTLRSLWICQRRVRSAYCWDIPAWRPHLGAWLPSPPCSQVRDVHCHDKLSDFIAASDLSESPFQTLLLVCLSTLHFQAVKSSGVYLVCPLPNHNMDRVTTTDGNFRPKGSTWWHVGRWPCLFPGK